MELQADPQALDKKFPTIERFDIRLIQGEQLSRFMNVILETMMISLPAEEQATPATRANIMGGLVDGRIQAWAILGKPEGKERLMPVGFGSTIIRTDEILNAKNLLIYTLYSYAVMSNQAYRDMWDTLGSYAKDNGCVRVCLYSDNPRVDEMAKFIGFQHCGFLYKNLEK